MNKNDSLIIFDKEVRFSANKRKWQTTKGPYTAAVFSDKDVTDGWICEVKKYNFNIGTVITPVNTEPTIIKGYIARIITYHLENINEAERWAKDQRAMMFTSSDS